MGRVSGMEISSSQGLKKPPKISPREETLSSQGPQARGRQEFPSQGLILRFFSTQGMKKYPYLKPTTHSEIVFLQELTKRYFYFMLQFDEFFPKSSTYIKKLSNCSIFNDFHMGGHVEIGFLHGGSCGNQISFHQCMTISRFLKNVWKFVNGRRMSSSYGSQTNVMLCPYLIVMG